ncbi:MAG TPA: AAA family ATPase [Candidatus Nanopelagicales bacterium]|jgi:SpoVK/Ycf46/Vps4 family AAA+-type ATPase
MNEDELIAGMERAVSAAPHDTALRLHLSELLVAAGRGTEAVAHIAAVLQVDPSNEVARALMESALRPFAPEPSAAPATGAFDWNAADAQMADVVPPMFASPSPEAFPVELERSTVHLSDVGGMEQVKSRIEVSFLMPMRNPELRAAYGKSLRGGLLMYGPPGCGKTFIARAIAGELSAGFISVALSDVLDMYVGQSERNLHDLFQSARRAAPCVLFLDEVDALGQKRSLMRNTPARNTVNQLLHEMDGANQDNEGVFVLAATNHPWDVDEALRRPGRLDRTVAVLPPDEAARAAIVHHLLQNRPVAAIDVRAIARLTEGYSGADLAQVCESAVEYAMVDSATSGVVRLIEQGDLLRAVAETTPSIGPWLETAKTVVQFANTSGQYDELRDYLKHRKLL